MRFIIDILCLLWLIQGSLQCFQARLDLADQGFGDLDNVYNEPNDAIFVKDEDLVKRSFDENGKGGEKEIADTKEEDPVDDDKESPEVHEEAEELPRELRRRTSGQERRRSRHEGVRPKHKLKLNGHRKRPDSHTQLAEDGPLDQEPETAQYYLTNDSDMRNISSFMLGPGPVSIPILEPSTLQVPPSRSSVATTPAGTSRTKTVDASLRNAQHLSLADIGQVSLVGEDKKGNKRKLKSHDEDFDLNDKSVVVKHRTKEDGSFHKHNAHFHREGHLSGNQRDGHKRRKHKFRKDASQTKKGMGKYYQRDEEQFTNLSTINKSFKNVARKQGDFKNRVGPSSNFDVYLDEEDIKERARMITDKLSKEELEKLNFLNTLHQTGEDRSSLKDENTIENEKLDTRNLYRSNNPQGGIKSKIEHGDWVYQVTLLPLPDYNIRKRNRTNDKTKLFSFGSRKNIKESEDKENKEEIRKIKKKSIYTTGNNEGYFDESAEKSENNPESDQRSNIFVSGKIKNNEEGIESKRGGRDAELRAKRHNLKFPKSSSFFNHFYDTKSEKRDEPVFDPDLKPDDKGHSNLKDTDEKKLSNSDFLEKEDDHYGYDPNFSSDEKLNAIPIKDVGNQTACATTPTTCAPTPGLNKELLSRTTKKAVKQKTALKSCDNPETMANNRSTEFEPTNKTKDPYESFLCGQLADSFVEEVLRKVKVSRKIARELGYTNETEETCDRCIELKPLKLPDSVAMRNSLGKCSKSRVPAGGCSTCYSVPKPMTTYLDLLVSYERENENALYSKIQDDSTFIFTGDYPEAMLKGKIKEKVEYESSFHKDNLERPHLREDLNEEKNEEKTVHSDSIERPKEQFGESESNGGSLNNDVENSNEKQSEGKRTMRTFSKSKVDETKEEQFPDIDEHLGYDDIPSGFDPPISDPTSKASSYNKELLSNTNGPVEDEKPEWTDGGNTKEEYSHDSPDSPKQADEKLYQNYERVHGKNYYDYYKQESPIKPRLGHKPKYGESPLNTFPKKNRGRNSFYKVPNSNRIGHTGHVKNDFVGYPVKKIDPYKKMSLNEKFMHQSKYDSLYDENGEYSLYPNLEGRSVEEVAIPESYGAKEAENARMVKRYAENVPVYDDEQNVLFEIPDIEYDLY